jgi:hypothetical protein
MIARVSDYVVREINKNRFKFLFLLVAWVALAVIMFISSDLSIYTMFVAVVIGGIMGFAEIFFIIIPVQRRLDRIINRFRAAG